MKEADYIDKSDLGDEELGFENLRKLGIAEIQQLAGNNWTDFNTHDPGVTILEQLCFAVTELAYKTEFDIKDLLASQQNKAIINDTFFSAANVLLGKPVTTTDFRKVLIDRIDGLRDVWIEPLNLTPAKNEIKGMYVVLISPSPVVIKTEEDKKKLILATRKCLEKYSNLGEAFNDIVVLEQEEIYVSAEIELENEANVDETHARVLFNIKRFISSPISFYSLEEMFAMDYPHEEIFDGPKLHHGFIKSEDLKDKITTLLNSHLINIVLDVEGVSKVLRLEIQKAGSNIDQTFKKVSTLQMDDGIVIDMNKVAVLAKKMIPYNAGYKDFITYKQNQETAVQFNKNVIRYYRQIENEHKVNYSLLHSRINDIVPKNGIAKPLEDYYSVQEHFPAIYALGKHGIPPSFDPERTDKVKQLKTYLLAFEQIMTNYLAQLTNFSKLFSLDENFTQTYFEGSLSSVPHIKNLVFGMDAAETEDEVENFSKEISKKALQSIESFDVRRHKALDHLLARFGERISNFGISNFNYNYSAQDHRKRLIASKVNMLKEITFLSSKRARSFNSQKEIWIEKNDDNDIISATAFQNVSYLERKTKIRLGIESLNKNFTEYLQQKIGKWKQSRILTPRRLSLQLSQQNMNIDNLVLHSIQKLGLTEARFEPKIDIESDLLRRGVWPDNFKIITDKKDINVNLIAFSKKLEFNAIDVKIRKDIESKLFNATKKLDPKPQFIRFLDDSDKKQPLLIEFQTLDAENYHPVPNNVWGIIKSCKTEADAQEYAAKLVHYLRTLNINSEGFHLIDHIELRPKSEKNLYGILLKDKNTNTGFISANMYNYSNMQSALTEMIQKVRKSQYVHESDGKTTLIYQGEKIGYYKALDSSKTIDSRREQNLKHLFHSLTDFDLYDPSVIQFYFENNLNKELGDGLFYSFRVSIVVPVWSSRFADREFQKVMEKTIREDVPAHISLDFYYLKFDEMKQFELRYSNWLYNMREHLTGSVEKVNKSSLELALYIRNLEELRKTKK